MGDANTELNQANKLIQQKLCMNSLLILII